MGDGPTDEADANDGENNGERAQDVFPEEFGVLRVYFPAGGTDGEHDWGFETGNRFEFFDLMRRDKDITVREGDELEWKRGIQPY